MNYTIEEYLLDEHNAASKARRDVSLFILQNGFQSLFKNDKTKMRHNKWAKLLLTIQLCARLLMIGKEDILFIQTSLIVLRPILIIKAIKKFKVIYLIHDLYCLRYNTEHSIKEHSEEIRRDISLISQCDGVIAHNKSMVQKLKDFGCTSKLASLEVFDYDCPFPAKARTLSVDEKPKVVFAGYLGKAEFLKKLDDASHENYELVIYGIPKIEVNHSFYKGSIDAELLPSVIEGHFGLIWEGVFNAVQTDNYMCVNNPHKLSMYIVAGLPIIAWDKSAIAQFIKSNGIGITVGSLGELDNCVKEVTPDVYASMVKNCLSIREKVVAGGYLQDALKSCLSDI